MAYVFLEDGRLLNAEIIRQGYGFAYTRFPFARTEEFRRLEREAREQRRGCGTHIKLTSMFCDLKLSGQALSKSGKNRAHEDNSAVDRFDVDVDLVR